jgi:hypothetical protein
VTYVGVSVPFVVMISLSKSSSDQYLKFQACRDFPSFTQLVCVYTTELSPYDLSLTFYKQA